MVPASTPSTDTGMTTMAHEASGSTPCSVPMATVSPVSRMSRSSETTTSCCSRMVRTERTVSTASKAAAMRDDPPTKSWSPPSADAERAQGGDPRGDHGVDRRVAAGRHVGRTWASGRSEGVGGQAAPGVGQDGVVDLLGELDGLLLDGAVGQDHDHQGQPVAEADQLHRPDGRRLVGGADHHGRAVGEVGQQSGGALEHLLDLAVGVVEELADLLAAARVERRRCRRGGRRRSGSPCRSGCGRRWCGAGSGSRRARGRPCRSARWPTRR